MRAILIDPAAETVTEVEYSGDIHHIYELTECETFTAVGIEHDDAIYVDDEGLLKDDPKYFFMYRGYHQPLAGRGLILGTDDEGNSVEPVSTLAEIVGRITFVQLKLKGFADNSGTINHPILGPDTPFISHDPIFGIRED